MGREGGLGPLPTKLSAPAWGHIGCDANLHSDAFSFTAAVARWRPFPDDRTVVFHDVVVAAVVAPEADFQRVANPTNRGRRPTSQKPNEEAEDSGGDDSNAGKKKSADGRAAQT